MTKHVVLKGNLFLRASEDGGKTYPRTKTVADAGLFSRAEAEEIVAGRRGDGWSHQPLGFYAEHMLDLRNALDEKLALLGVDR